MPTCPNCGSCDCEDIDDNRYACLDCETDFTYYYPDESGILIDPKVDSESLDMQHFDDRISCLGDEE
jgi:hypothetical protein